MAKTSAAASAPGQQAAAHEYAIVVDGGRQYRVTEGQELEIDFRHLPAGSEVVFDEVLAVSKGGQFTLGKPKVKGAKVKAEVVGLVQGDKIYVQKFARRKNYRRRTGHRAISTKVRIASISA
ncbi:MAG: 50S ribosomal protein L21 [Planctomycetota bacterium]|nr:50S ribosomal protein L21 [Planctomycetota bacterium]